MLKKINAKDLKDYIGKEIEYSAFVDTIRDKKWVQFVILRDNTGIVQMTIEKSLEEQRWYRDQSLYNQLINYVNKQIKKDFDVTIEKDHEPQWDGENCVYTIVAWYKDDIMPAETFRINELLSKYVYDFCSENDCMDLMYRTYIDSDWVGLKDE